MSDARGPSLPEVGRLYQSKSRGGRYWEIYGRGLAIHGAQHQARVEWIEVDRFSFELGRARECWISSWHRRGWRPVEGAVR